MIAYILTMPQNNAWNGRWSGEKHLYAMVRPSRSKHIADKILEKKNYSYNFGDGWVANIEVRQVNSAEANKLRKKSVGFACYDWCVDSIEKYQEIKVS